MVTFNSGPHGAATTDLSAFDRMAAAMGLARLKVNPRGSAGMGDEVLQAIVGNVGEVRQEINAGACYWIFALSNLSEVNIYSFGTIHK